MKADCLARPGSIHSYRYVDLCELMRRTYRRAAYLMRMGSILRTLSEFTEKQYWQNVFAGAVVYSGSGGIQRRFSLGAIT
jgi:hypothetical protein